MIPLSVEIEGNPQTAEEWAKAVEKAKAVALEKARAAGLSDRDMEGLEKELARLSKVMTRDNVEQISAQAMVKVLGEMLKLGYDMPRVTLALGKGFSLSGKHAHNFSMGVVQSEIVTALACLEHAQKVLRDIDNCDCHGEPGETKN